ncbi:uncharacterized protein RJT21DRAFT_117561, partial [Scheffersomyces amazonensis]|uniref:uncharacterized protein n=1 Tax=Scheffersomyces amazonensis TaxID=1078765 RepID=UPI00315DB752
MNYLIIRFFKYLSSNNYKITNIYIMSAYHIPHDGKFLTLSSEVSEPFIIPNVSPISSPKLLAIPSNTSEASAKPIYRRLSNTMVEPLNMTEERDFSDDATLVSERSMSILDL